MGWDAIIIWLKLTGREWNMQQEAQAVIRKGLFDVKWSTADLEQPVLKGKFLKSGFTA